MSGAHQASRGMEGDFLLFSLPPSPENGLSGHHPTSEEKSNKRHTERSSLHLGTDPGERDGFIMLDLRGRSAPFQPQVSL